MITVFSFYCIEALGMLTTGSNIMYRHQAFSVGLNGVGQSLTTSSVCPFPSLSPFLQTMLVIYVSILRCLVVVQPLKYAHNSHNRLKTASLLPVPRNPSFQANSISQSRSSAAHSGKEEAVPLHPSFRRNNRPIQFRKVLKPFLLPRKSSPPLTSLFSSGHPRLFRHQHSRLLRVHPRALLRRGTQHGGQLSSSHCLPLQRESHNEQSQHIHQQYATYKTVLMTITQTVGPVITILFFSVLTEYHVHRSLKARRK